MPMPMPMPMPLMMMMMIEIRLMSCNLGSLYFVFNPAGDILFDIGDLANCDGATEGRTDTTSYRDAEAHLKMKKKKIKKTENFPVLFLCECRVLLSQRRGEEPNS